MSALFCTRIPRQSNYLLGPLTIQRLANPTPTPFLSPNFPALFSLLFVFSGRKARARGFYSSINNHQEKGDRPELLSEKRNPFFQQPRFLLFTTTSTTYSWFSLAPSHPASVGPPGRLQLIHPPLLLLSPPTTTTISPQPPPTTTTHARRLCSVSLLVLSDRPRLPLVCWADLIILPTRSPLLSPFSSPPSSNTPWSVPLSTVLI